MSRKSDKKMRQHRPYVSNAQLDLPYPHDKSQDLHDTYDSARSVCDRLQSDGYGGGGQIFPVRTWVTREGSTEEVFK